MMNLCESNHQEVAYEGKTCPMCALQEELEDLRERVVNLESEIEDISKVDQPNDPRP